MAATEKAKPKGMRKQILKGKKWYAAYRGASRFITNKANKLHRLAKRQPNNGQIKSALARLANGDIKPRHGRGNAKI